MLYKVHCNSNHRLFSELSSAFNRVRHSRATAAAHSLFEVSRCRTSQFARCFLPDRDRMWNNLPCNEYDRGTLDGFKGAVNRWLIPLVVFFSVFRGTGSCRMAQVFPLMPVLLVLIVIIIIMISFVLFYCQSRKKTLRVSRRSEYVPVPMCVDVSAVPRLL